MIRFAAFQRKLSLPLRYGNLELRERRGYLLQADGPDGPFFSEACPLPGHSRDTLEDIANALSRGPAETTSRPPALRFALECLQAARGPFHSVRSCALIPPGISAAVGALQLASAAGYGTVKLKLGAGSTSDWLSLLREFPGFRFRLDANNSLSAVILERFLNALHSEGLTHRVDYVEEPFSGVWDAGTFRAAGVSFAADESAADPVSWGSLLDRPNPPGVLVVKPAVTGGLRSLPLDEVRRAGVRTVFGSSIETEPGRRALISLLASLGTDEACGLATGFLLEGNSLEDRPEWRCLHPVTEAERSWCESLHWSEWK